jgi:hypothetical protein
VTKVFFIALGEKLLNLMRIRKGVGIVVAIYITTFNFEHVNNITSQTYSTGIIVTAKKKGVGQWWGWRLLKCGVRYG